MGYKNFHNYCSSNLWLMLLLSYKFNTEINFINTNHNCPLNSNRKNCENFESLNAKNQNTTHVKVIRGFNLTKKLIPLSTIFWSCFGPFCLIIQILKQFDRTALFETYLGNSLFRISSREERSPNINHIYWSNSSSKNAILNPKTGMTNLNF